MSDNADAALEQNESIEEVYRERDAFNAHVDLTTGWTREYNTSVRKVFIECRSGKVRVAVLRLGGGGERAARIYSAGDRGGVNGGSGGGAHPWGPCSVKVEAIEPSDIYYHVEWD